MQSILGDAQKTTISRFRRVASIQPDGDRIPLFLVAPGIESVSFVRHLGPSQPVFGIRVPHPSQIPEPHTIAAVAAECVAGVREIRPKGPYALGGWCAAGVVALEMARQLEHAGEEVGFVVLFDARNVLMPPLRPIRRLYVRTYLYGQRVGFFIDRVRRQGVGRIRAALTARVRSVTEASRHVGKKSAPSVVIAGLRRYRPDPWAGRVVHIWAADRPKGKFRDPHFSWDHISPDGFVFYEVPGDHITMLQEPCVARVAEILAQEINAAMLRESLGSGQKSKG